MQSQGSIQESWIWSTMAVESFLSWKIKVKRIAMTVIRRRNSLFSKQKYHQSTGLREAIYLGDPPWPAYAWTEAVKKSVFMAHGFTMRGIAAIPKYIPRNNSGGVVTPELERNITAMSYVTLPGDFGGGGKWMTEQSLNHGRRHPSKACLLSHSKCLCRQRKQRSVR